VFNAANAVSPGKPHHSLRLAVRGRAILAVPEGVKEIRSDLSQGFGQALDHDGVCRRN
jgi:hypothetical protein